MKTLSIGIPTYNRKNIVKKNVINILSNDFLQKNNIDLIVSDNYSKDNTFKELKKIKIDKNNPNFYISQNKKNLGVFKNIFKIFQICKSNYLILTSDEEFINKKNISKLVNFLENYKPTFVSTQFYLNNTLYRGSEKLKKIRFEEWKTSSFFSSGLVFDVKAVNSILKDYLDLLTKDNLYYVQSLIVSELMMKKPDTQWYFNFPLTNKKYQATSFIDSNIIDAYWTIPGRYYSFLSIENYFQSRLKQKNSNQLIKFFIKKNRENLYPMFVNTLKKNKPEMIKDFQIGVANYEFSPFSKFFLSIMRIRSKLKNYLKKFK